MKTETQSFTPGPWRASLQHGRTYLLDSTASGSRKNVGDIAVNNPVDARLIAAAPDMLAALEMIVKSAHPHPVEHKGMWEAWNVAHAAIALVRGHNL